jgi:hypothetical protein
LTFNKNDERSWQHVQVMEWACKGLTYREISEKTGVNIGTISGILHDINLEAKAEIKGWLEELMPIEFKKSLLLNQYIHKKAMEMSENTKDDRVKCQALNILQQNDEKKRLLLTDNYVLNNAFDFVDRQKIQEKINEIKNNTVGDNSEDDDNNEQRDKVVTTE